jgi:hypothetical protein
MSFHSCSLNVDHVYVLLAQARRTCEHACGTDTTGTPRHPTMVLFTYEGQGSVKAQILPRDSSTSDSSGGMRAAPETSNISTLPDSNSNTGSNYVGESGTKKRRYPFSSGPASASATNSVGGDTIAWPPSHDDALFLPASFWPLPRLSISNEVL